VYPLKLKPALKDYIWGGDKLKKDFNIETEQEIVAEAWLLSIHPDGESIITNGELAGKKLSEVLSVSETEAQCPILIKLIDAKDNLSIQVHPDDDYAAKFENSKGKTELWYIVDCEPDATLIYGFNQTVTKEEFKKRIENNTLLEVLNTVKVKKGDVFFIEPGTIHAIGKGIVIAEIQQSSNITYRVYDYGRTDKQGNPRQLHMDKALDVTCLNVQDMTKSAQLPLACKYFKIKKIELDGVISLEAKEEFHSILVLEGSGKIKSNQTEISFIKGDSFYIPKDFGKYLLEGQAEIIFTTL
jgi:mannose-6-phosphate isomerase